MHKPGNDGIRSTSLMTYFFARLRRHPHLLFPALYAYLKGWWYKVKFRLQLKSFSAGRYFRVYGQLLVSGPGRVEFGDDCLVISNAIKPVCIRTLTRGAVVQLGDHVGLNGTAIQCARRIDIRRFSNVADAYITDSPAHSLDENRRDETIEDVEARPVKLGENVWVSVQVVILDGVEIGDNSVIGACSLVRKEVPRNVLAAGNPLKILRQL